MFETTTNKFDKLKKTIKIRFLLPSGINNDYSFTPEHTLQDLYDYVDSIDDNLENYTIFANMPRTKIENNTTLLKDTNMFNNMIKLYVQDNNA